MAVWAIAWAGSKPIASLSDGLLASGTHLNWSWLHFSWDGLGIRWTGVLLAVPALIPVVMLIVLALMVVTVRKWKPSKGRPLAQPLETLANFPWIRRAEELLVSAPQPEIREEAPISV